MRNSCAVSSVPEEALKSQIENFQTTLASLNQQVIFLQESLQEKDEKITELEANLVQCKQSFQAVPQSGHTDNTLTIIGLLINLYKFISPPGKEKPAKSVQA